MRCAQPLAVALCLAAPALATEPAKRYDVQTPKNDGIIAAGINGRGQIIGFEWMEEKDHPGVVAQVPFFAKGKDITFLPLLKGYTATFPAAVSDRGEVVGRASKPAPPGVRVYLRNQAFIWDAALGIRGIGCLKDDSASFACGITRDGRRISGFSVGDNRMRACVWDRSDDGWKGTPLPHAFQLGSNVVAISDDGKYVAAVDGELPCLWSEEKPGKWIRYVFAEPSSLIPRAVNNLGTVVGLHHTGDGLTHAVVWSRKGGYHEIEKPPGHARAEALAVNNHDVVVGMVDGPAGSPIGPKAFVYAMGHIRVLDEGGPNFVSATAINDKDQVTGVFEKEEEAADAQKKERDGK